MKKTEKFIVIRNKENGHFLQEYENNNRALAYSSKWTDDLRDAANNSVESIEKRDGPAHRPASRLPVSGAAGSHASGNTVSAG